MSAEFPLPESAVTAEIEYREHDVVHSARATTTRRCSSTYLEQQGKTREEFDAELREVAEKVGPSAVHPRRDRRSRRRCRSATPS